MFHGKSIDDTIKALKTDSKKGLTSDEAAARLATYGENRLRDKKKKRLYERFFAQFKDVMILILLGAAAISFAIACVEKQKGDFIEPVLIVLIVIVNAVMGVVQENKAEKALEALKNLSAPHSRVIRDGTEILVQSSTLVPGDLLVLSAGDFVSADSRLIFTSSMKSDESALTGESQPVFKDALKTVPIKTSLGDRCNIVYSGCAVTYGTGRAIVTATGMDTEMGKIANLLESSEETQTPLQKKLLSLGTYLGIAAIIACALIFAIGVYSGINTIEIFMTAVALAVSAIPEGLPAIVTVILSVGVQRMVKHNAIVRRLPAVETLGNASVICTDKTGTLTENKMTLVKAFTERGFEDISNNNSEQTKELLQLAALCCDASVIKEKNTVREIGDPTETSLVYAAYRNKIYREALNEAYPRLLSIPFDSNRKVMSVLVKYKGKYLIIVKGAPDILAKKCTSGNVDGVMRASAEMAKRALRVISVAVKEISAPLEKLTPEYAEEGLTMLGVFGMVDPPRKGVAEAVSLCRRAGIKTVMITGDHITNASVIAQQIGIMQKGDRAITGEELDLMSETDLSKAVKSIAVYARVTPENKIRIVRAWQRKGEVVAMTGDGVNDAPALKAADIGCAMGISGTDVAKGAADMTLADDNFSTIVESVKQGRSIYANIKKAVGYLLGTNIGEVVAVLVAMLIWNQSPFLSIQLLWINLVTDSLQAIALGLEPHEPHIMEQKPRPKNESIFSHGFGLKIIMQGIMFGAIALVSFHLGKVLGGSLESGQTLAFFSLALSQTLHAYNMRSDKSLFQTGFFGNKMLNRAVIVSTLLIFLAILTPINTAFGFVILPFRLYLIGVQLSILPFILSEITKAIKSPMPTPAVKVKQKSN